MLGIAYSSMATSSHRSVPSSSPRCWSCSSSPGVYFAFDDLPEWLKQVASVFPLKWIAQGMRSVFFPDDWQTQEMAGVVGARPHRPRARAWLVAGLVVCAPDLPLDQARHDMMVP